MAGATSSGRSSTERSRSTRFNVARRERRERLHPWQPCDRSAWSRCFERSMFDGPRVPVFLLLEDHIGHAETGVRALPSVGPVT